MATESKNIDNIDRTKTSLDGTERIPARDSSGDFKITVANLQASLSAPSTYYAEASYDVLDDDNYERVEFSTVAGPATGTLPLMANNLGRQITFAFVKNDASLDVVTISPHADDTNKLSNAGLASMTLLRPGESITFKQSVNSDLWEVVAQTAAVYTAASIYGCRAWVNFNGTGTVAIRASGNVSSITDGGVGIYTINFIVNMPDANYCGSLNAALGTGSQADTSLATYNVNNVTAYIHLGGVYHDPATISVAIFR